MRFIVGAVLLAVAVPAGAVTLGPSTLVPQTVPGGFAAGNDMGGGLDVNAPPSALTFFEMKGPLRPQFDPNSVGGGPRPPGVVPEPETWAMFILGFGALGAMLRRRRVLAA